ncbi:MAG TPA: L,D-transpeptidase [Longimicrobium sp.]|jgi:L,D-transpeptidase YbiS
MIAFRSTFARAAVATLAALGTVPLGADDAAAQARRRTADPPAGRSSTRTAPAPSSSQGGLRVRSEALQRGGYAVVIDLDANRLYFARGRRVLWSALVGTGTGLSLEGDDGEWDFDTPNGTFHVTTKAIEPDWIAPDWWFVEHDLPVPGPNDPRWRHKRGLGSAAVFIGHGLAIHGTDKPELLGRRVSHGCIRLSDADALRLYHNVQIGTEVVIVGGHDLPPAEPPPARTSRSRPAGTPPPRDPLVVELEGQETEVLLERLDRELFGSAFAEGAGDWPRVASVLLFRGVKEGDDAALAGLLTKVEDMGDGRLREEYATFLADAFTQRPLRTLEVLGSLDRARRAPVARAIVDATLGLYPRQAGDDASTPWPTRRAPREVLARAGQRAWDALRLAEQGYRDERGLAVRPPDR